ncbi:MAG TPA: enolase C-terminal domain-like protein, partial [Thermomicrobiales bacterium]|nr:enolase C-terminal domain-like protein [Thermomicrobiales bacterium]
DDEAARMTTWLTKLTTADARFELPDGAGADSVHSNPMYSFAVTRLHAGDAVGTGIVLTLGDGNDLVCQAIEHLASRLIGQDLDEIMANFGRIFNEIANDHQMRWLGPHKGVVHLALASITNALFDLWAKSRGVPLWKLLIDLSPEQTVALLDLSYLDDTLTTADALEMLQTECPSRLSRLSILETGYPGYDTSVGWFNYSDDRIRENVKNALAGGFTALKLKVGSADPIRDIRRANLLREAAGDDIRIMLDANQSWTLPNALTICPELARMNPFWIEEPTHPDDILGHCTLAQAIAPIGIAGGEHVPNRVVFKNYMQLKAAHFIQVDCTRVGGVSEFITVSLLARKFGLPVVPHVGDMGQIHQHLVLFNHIALGHQAIFLEHIPHLRRHFVHPANISAGVYRTPQEPGSSSDLIDYLD